MKFLKKLKSSNFWVSMISAVVLILQAVFNVDIKTEYLTQIILGILGVLVMSGIVTDSPNDEMAIKSSIDMDNIKELINTTLTQIGATMQMDINQIVSQLNKPEQTTTIVAETKPEKIAVVVEETNLEQPNLKKIEEIKTEVINAPAIKTEEVVQTEVVAVVEDVKPETIKVDIIENYAPKNEL